MKQHFIIDGKKTQGSNGTFDVISPRDQSILYSMPNASEADVLDAVEAAQRAFPLWRNMGGVERQKLFLAWADLIDANRDMIAAEVSAEMGVLKDDVAGTAAYIADMIRYYAGFIVTNYGDVLSFEDDHMNVVVNEPLGVIAAMPPWNSPIESTIQKCAPALAAGNTVVLRVPEEAPSGGLILAQLAVEAGFPAGVLNALAGMGPESGEALVGHPKVRLVSFTGSAPTGKIIARRCAEQMKPVVMELGGKSPVIIFDDARIADAIESSVSSAFCFQGQICCATTRVLVHESILDEVVKGIAERVERYAVDNEEFPIGPLFNDKVFHTVEKFVAQGKKDGTLVAGGGVIEREGGGRYHQPTVFLFKDDSSVVCKEEIFGPVLAIIPFSSDEEAITIANNVDYGLAATVYSENRQRIFRTIRQLESGTVWANCNFKFNMHMPWGGPKSTGIGREFGKYAMKPYLQEKNIWIGN